MPYDAGDTLENVEWNRVAICYKHVHMLVHTSTCIWMWTVGMEWTVGPF